MYEIEIKAHCSSKLKTTIEELTKEKGKPVSKRDVYYIRENGEVFRNRKIDGINYITIKERYTDEEGIETNVENEFFIKDEELPSYINNAKITHYKNKDGYSWSYKGVTCELFNVNNLGYFIELEIVSEKKIKAKETLYGLLKEFGVPLSNIEMKAYCQLIDENK